VNKLLPILVIIVFLALGSLVFFSGEDEQQNNQLSDKEPDANTLPALTDADRDTYVNTIQTMSARNKELQERLERVEKSQKEQERVKAKKEREFQRMVDNRVEERARSLTKTFSDKYDKLRAEFSDVTQLSDRKNAKSGMPKGLGLDDVKQFTSPVHTSKAPPAMQPSSNAVTIMPITTIATLPGKSGSEAVPLSITGEPIVLDKEISKSRRKSDKEKIASVPYFTIPQNATLFSNDTLTALVGIVPNLQGSVVDPIRFKVITGNTNMASNRKFLPPGVRDIVWSGIAIGNREMSCVRGEVHSVTFTFEDGTIRTINSQTDSGKNTLGGKMLGYIATRQGNPCLAGTLITNAQDYLMDRMLASGAAALASSFSDTQQTTTQHSDGTTSSFFSGDEGEYIAGQTLAGSLTELTSYLRERQRNAVDLVYLDAGQDVVLHVESQIEIDYEPEGRKLDHASDHSQLVGYHLD
jgi:integrating conjugative element protein (TIGR03752 family)